jgi:phospholipid/cholesterol/gamma-HCH transport system substrate-binding protein
MIFGKTKLELKVGVFVFIGVVIFVVFVLSVGGMKTWRAGYKLHCIFNFVNGVKVGAPVRFSGVDVGEVSKVDFFTPEGEKTPKVKVTVWLRQEAKIPVDSAVWVNTLGLLGEKYVEIMAGKDFDHPLENEAILVGNDPLAMQQIGEMAKKVVEDVDDVIVKLKNEEGTIGKLLYDDKIYQELEALIIDVRKHPWKLFWKGKEKK